MTKQELLKLVEALPEEASPDGFERIAVEVERVRFRAKIQRGLAQLDRGEGIPHEEIEAMIDGWLEE